MYCTSLFQLPQSTRWVCLWSPRTAADQSVDRNKSIVWKWSFEMMAQYTYAPFELRWESCLEFHWSAVTVIALNEHFHIIWLQCWRTLLWHFSSVFVSVPNLANEIPIDCTFDTVLKQWKIVVTWLRQLTKF